MSVADIERLVTQSHARFEAAEFLPLSQAIPGRDFHPMAAPGLSRHLRRHAQPDLIPACV